ncbi:peptidoglycan-associated lipoprotein Pal [Curvibacter sp. CHRR-16]|uniref:peptidoglycan-associated lipoprotein Pal n=1 Tax=Curvibacter sp. CHRR-16 TaxID=2835872 RepID=UPI001BDAFCA2|nr:peptidoglycan-associated lipoprotein Pal [Curvibacter sp. CHRR-16]MBT0571787.1 peptidoglycan-associated lipoprotein Pal [Curvibacter sp. CHRR-16]
MKRYVLTLTAALVLSACGSSVKLNDVQVEDRSGTPASAINASNSSASDANTGTAVSQSNVASVDVNQAQRSVDAFLKTTERVVYFDFDSYVLRTEAQPVIEAHAKFLKANPARKVNLEGHTDERGGREYNLALGQKRAEAVRKALALQGVSDTQMEAVSFGKEKPAAQGGTEDAMAKNRRVEFTYR